MPLSDPFTDPASSLHDAPSTPVNLRHTRRRRGKSLAQMAEEIGICDESLARAERGVIPRATTQLKIAQTYHLDPVTQWPDPMDEAESA